MQLDLLQPSLSLIHDHLTLQTLHTSSITQEMKFETAVDKLLRGHTLILIDGIALGYIIDTQGWKMRSITEPVSETVIRGPREGFIESLRVNTGLLRRKVAHPSLTIEEFEIGKITRTKIAIAYIEGLPPQILIQEIKNRLQKVDIQKILESNYIEECLEDAPLSIFPTIGTTERPDVVAARIIEGRISIMIDGSSSALIAPMLFFDLFRMTEDYNSRVIYASFTRMLRFLCVLLSTLGPAIYLAAQNFQQELIPPHLFISFLLSRSNTPFSLFFEILMLLIVFEILKEVGVRMPSPLSSSIPLIGGIILGEAAVRAGFTAESTIIVVAICAFSGYLVPTLDQVNTLLRFVYLVVASFLGMYGITLVFIFILIHLASIKSFGYFYMSPYFPLSWLGWKDFLVRLPHTILRKGPQVLTRMHSMGETEPMPPTRSNLHTKEVNALDESNPTHSPSMFRHIVWQWLRGKNNRISNKS
jgi:spore germination protein KA